MKFDTTISSLLHLGKSVKKGRYSPLMLVINIVVFAVVFRIVLNHFYNFDAIVAAAKTFYHDYGFWVLSVSSLIEAIILVGLYYPGSTIILLGASLAALGSISLWQVILWTTLGLVLGYAISYYIGTIAWKKFKKTYNLNEDLIVSEKEKINYPTFFWSTFHPNIASVISVIAGGSKIQFFPFLFLVTVTQLFWSAFWAVTFYYFGLLILQQVLLITGIAIAIYASYVLISLYRQNLKKTL